MRGFERKDKHKQHLNYLIGNSGRKKIDTAIKKNNAFISELDFNFSKEKKTLPVIAFNIHSGDFIIGQVIIITDSPQENNQLQNNLFHNSILRAMNTRSDAVWFVTNIQNGKNSFTSASVKEIYGWDPECFNLGGWFFFFSIAHPDDFEYMFKTHGEWILMKNKLGLLYDHVEFNNTFRIRNTKNEFVKIETESNVLERDESGKIKSIFGSFRLVDMSNVEYLNAEKKDSSIKIIDGKTYIELDYLKQLREQRADNTTNNKFKDLSSRELEILELIVDEFSSEEIAQKINISIHTVNLHRKQLMKKLEAKNLAGLIRIYYTSK